MNLGGCILSIAVVHHLQRKRVWKGEGEGRGEKKEDGEEIEGRTKPGATEKRRVSLGPLLGGPEFRSLGPSPQRLGGLDKAPPMGT